MVKKGIHDNITICILCKAAYFIFVNNTWKRWKNNSFLQNHETNDGINQSRHRNTKVMKQTKPSRQRWTGNSHILHG